MERRQVMFAMAAARLLPVGGQAFAQGKGIEKDKLEAVMGGGFATATSELAAAKAKNRMVKTFAELEIAEQAAVAKAFGSKPDAAGLSEKHAAMVEKLQAAEGAQFDLMYIDGQIDGHEGLLTIHKSYASSGDDSARCLDRRRHWHPEPPRHAEDHQEHAVLIGGCPWNWSR